MHIEIPPLSPQQFGQLVHQLANQVQVPGSAALQLVAVQHLAAGLASGELTITAAPKDA